MNEPIKLPVVQLKGTVLFPGSMLPFTVEHTSMMRAIEAAATSEGKVFAVAERSKKKVGGDTDLYSMGVIAQIGLTRRGSEITPMMLQGEKRARAVRFDFTGKAPMAMVTPVEDMPPVSATDVTFQALFNETRERAKELGSLYGIPTEAVSRVVDIAEDPAMLTDQLAGFSDLSMEEKQGILETLDVEERLRKILLHLQQRISMLKAQEQIKSQVQEQLGNRQREMYLREQLKTIQEELGENDDQKSDIDGLKQRLFDIALPEHVRTEVDRELARLVRSQESSSEAQVARTFLEWIADLPWDRRSDVQLDLGKAMQVLDEDHYGLADVKDRILEFLAVRRLRADRLAKDEDQVEVKSRAMAKGPILLFAGPPGVGKTSIAKSIARAIGREYVRVSLGGTRDEADIRGHRRTYVGALPGRIVQGLKQAGTKNPVFLLDEIDKLGVSYQGDPASALMEVLDPAQNDSFVDHYLGVPFDLSEVLFIATANYVQNIPGPLLDRMEVVEFTGYTEDEKLKIATGYLVPRQLEESGLSEGEASFTDEGIRHIAGSYTRESGVRQLEREIGRLTRKVARQIATGEQERLELNRDEVGSLLGKPRVRQERVGSQSEVGVATGMYYTPTGGDIMFVEAQVREIGSSPREGDRRADGLGAVSLILTGQLGDVMKESARAALTYATTHAVELDIPSQNLGSIEAHVHVPAGAIPKDGPSAGITLATALTSAMSGRPVDKEIAMTGEITLRGRVLPIGGIKEKVLGAHRAGVKQIILPAENEVDVEDVPEKIRHQLVFHFVNTLEEVLSIALLPPSYRHHSPHGAILTAEEQPTQIA